MILSNIARRLVAAASTATVALAITSCGAGNTVDYVYVTSNSQNPGQVNAYALDSESGALHQLSDSPYPSGGRNPVYAVTSPNGLNLYVANHDDNTIVQFAIGTDGKLYPQTTVNTPGTEPVALAINPAGTVLYALDYYAPAAPGQPSYTDLNPGPGAVVAFPINSNGSLGTALASGAANYFTVQCFPSDLTITGDGNFLYVTNTNAVITTTSPPVTGTVPTLPAGCPNSGTLSGFSVAPSGSASVGLLTSLGSPVSTGSGSEPTGITATPLGDSSAGDTVFVTDAGLNQLYTYTTSNGSLTLASTVATGNMPMGATVVDPPASSTGKFLYVTNYTDGSISSFSLSSGVPVALTTTTAGAPGPLCVIADPRLQRFLFSADYIGGRVGGAELNPATGGLITNQGSPYVTSGQPTCVAAVQHIHGNAHGL
ncbi:MAG: beta-propeller fold lactonase family protein [Acidobacteriaceae bacterium]